MKMAANPRDTQNLKHMPKGSSQFVERFCERTFQNFEFNRSSGHFNGPKRPFQAENGDFGQIPDVQNAAFCITV